MDDPWFQFEVERLTEHAGRRRGELVSPFVANCAPGKLSPREEIHSQLTQPPAIAGVKFCFEICPRE